MSLLYALLIGPIEFIIEFVFAIIYRFSENPGISIIGVSLIVQLLVLPLYKRSDAIQEEERNKQKSMEKWVNQIKRCYHGDKRVMVLSAYYREQNYKPIYALKGAVSLLLEIPFFIAAYDFLSHLNLLEGFEFLFVKNLGKPDELIHFGTFSVNALPVLMTLINVISGAIYTREFKFKEKFQLYLMALVFLVLLYNSPSGLVLYWTLNNLFSLFKNIFAKFRGKFGKFWYYFCALAGVLIFLIAEKKGYTQNLKKTIFFIAVATMSFLPLLLSFKKKEKRDILTVQQKKTARYIFYAASIFLTVLLGLIIPTSIIKASPTEFTPAPMSIYRIIITTLCLFCGLFLVWFNVFYLMMSDNLKRIFSFLMLSFCLIGTVNFLFFGKNLGFISYNLVYDKPVVFSMSYMLKNLLVDIFVFGLSWMLFFRFSKVAKNISFIIVVSALCVSVVNIFTINIRLKERTANQTTQQISDDEKILRFSKTGKNLMLIMLDRAPGYLFPFELEMYPKLREMYDGFVFYPNTISFAGYTYAGSPAVFGGYDYTPYKGDKTSNKNLWERNKESLTMLPLLLGKNDYDVTVINPPTEEYVFRSDISIYDGMKNVRAYDLYGKFRYVYEQNYSVPDVKSFVHNYFWFPIMKVCPLCLYDPIYDNGSYVSTGADVLNSGFIDNYSALMRLKNITEVDNNPNNSLILLQNDTPHKGLVSEVRAVIPTTEDFVPYAPEKFIETKDEEVIDTSDYVTVYHLRAGLAAFITIGEWFDYLKRVGVYDNTRIVITSDHGFGIKYDRIKGGGPDFNPVFLFKDFGSTGFSVSDEFMTNADGPSLLVKELIEKPINPYTGNPIDDSVKKGEEMMILSEPKSSSEKYDVGGSTWWKVHDSIFEEANWEKIKTSN